MCVTRDEGEDEDEQRSEEDARRGDVQEKQEPHTKDVGKKCKIGLYQSSVYR